MHFFKLLFFCFCFSVYNTCTLLLKNERYVDANLDAPDNVISGNEPSSEMLACQSQIPDIYTGYR